MRKNESGVMVLEAIYILPVFLVVILLFHTAIPMFQMKATVTKASLNAMMSLSQDPVFTEIIQFNNSTSDKASGVGDLIEQGIGKNGWLVRQKTEFVDTQRWYYNKKTTVTEKVYDGDKSEADVNAAIALAINTYIESHKSEWYNRIDAALKNQESDWYGTNSSANSDYFKSMQSALIDEFRKNTTSISKLTAYIDKLDRAIPKMNDKYGNVFNAIDGISPGYGGSTSTGHVSPFFTTKVDYNPGWWIFTVHYKFNASFLTKAQFQSLDTDLKKILEDNAHSVDRETYYSSFDDAKVREVASQRFVAYLTGEDKFDDIEKVEAYKKFAKRFGITKTKFERLSGVKEADYGFDFDSTHFDTETGKLVMSIHYHTVYGINLFNQILPHDFVVTSRTSMWPGNKKLDDQTTKKKWTTTPENKNNRPSWAN
ncbi:MAG: hypothetical protein LBN08_06625 [Lactobacillales bacterium]|nr:hypothetical protein [Lactobacillales bacterium]